MATTGVCRGGVTARAVCRFELGSQERREVVVLLEHCAHGCIADDPLAVVGILQLTCFRVVPYCIHHQRGGVSDRECTERAEHLLPTFVLLPQQPGQDLRA